VIRKRTVQTKRVKTDQSGRVKVTYDDRIVDRATATVEFAWYAPGRGTVTREVPLSSLGWGPVDLSQPGTVPTTASPRAPVYTWTGFYIGVQGSGTAWDQSITERIAGTHTVTNRLNDYNTAGGIGVVGGFDWAPGLSGVTFGPVASFSYIGQSNDHTFAGGFFIGTHINWSATLGGRLGWQVNDRILMYAVGGAEFLNYDFRSNFTGPVLSIGRTATGWFAGGGVEYSQPDWRTANGQWTVFGQMTVSEFCGELFRMPAFSPGFDYRVASEQVRVTAGFTFRPSWGAPPPPPPPP
jgi:outer membrane immunogenic protein